ncbi:MAG TPA: type II secretion system secretin GspD [Steroidobacteraceae bacterium]
MTYLRILACMLVVAGSVATAQQAQQLITPNFKDADIVEVATAVMMATKKNFIIDPRVRAQVTVLSSTPMTPEAFYQLFLSVLEVHGFVAVPAGDVIKLLPDANARQHPANDLPDSISSSSDEFVTQVIPVRNVSAAQLVPILRVLIPQYGHLAAYPQGNILIVSDRAANVNRIQRIIRRIDQASDADVEIVQLQNASAAEIVRVINSLYAQAQGAPDAGGVTPMRIVADERSNSVLISGDQSQRLRIKTLIAHLDTPLETGGDTRVRYLQYADAEKIAAKLKEQVTGIVQAQPGGGGGGAAPAGPQAAADRSTTIWADPDMNALVITAPPKMMKSLMSIVDQLDIRRAQVLVEAIIAEVRADKTAELGVNWAVWSEDDGTRIPIGGFLSPVGDVNLAQLAGAIDNPSSAPQALARGATFGIGRIADRGTNFAAMLRAIREDANTNLLSFPSAVTMDNQEAELKVAQEVPFITGQFTNTNTGDGSVNPFQTIQREEVGTILKVTPQINEGGTSVLLKIELESSSIAASTVQAADIITNKRTISTNVLIEDGGIVVLGGLVSDEARQAESRVPYLGRIPLIGNLFKTRSGDSLKSNLMVFIKPTILRDGVQTAIATHSKYNFMREEQRRTMRRELLPLLPGVKKPQLPDPPPMPDPETVTPAPTPKERQEAAEQRPPVEGGLRPVQPQPAPTPAPQSTPPAQTPPPPEEGSR